MAKVNKHPIIHKQKPPKISQIEEEKFMGIMRSIGNDSLNNLSKEHITEVINQRGKIADYIHEENMQMHERFKITQTSSVVILIIILLFAIIVLALVAYIDKSYLPETLTLIIGFIGGFGIGKTFKDPTDKKE